MQVVANNPYIIYTLFVNRFANNPNEKSNNSNNYKRFHSIPDSANLPILVHPGVVLDDDEQSDEESGEDDLPSSGF